MYFGIPRNQKFATVFNIISLHLDALSPSLSQLVIPSKQVFTLVPQVLICCIYDTFIVSESPSTKVSFQFLGTDRSQKGLTLENTGDEERLRSPHSVAAAMETCDVCTRLIILQDQNASSQLSSPLPLNLLTQPQFFFTVYRAAFLNIINHDHSLIIRIDRGHYLPC